MKLSLVRHGESEANLAGRWQGQSDSPLSATGRDQAQALASRLEGEAFDLVLASDLTRAKQTAEALERPMDVDPAWREVDVGAWEGLERPEVARRFADQVQRLMAGDMDVAIGGGESWNEMHRRIDRALEALIARVEPGARVLVVSHGGVIGAIIAQRLGIRERWPRPLGRLDNTSVTTIHIEQGAATRSEMVTRHNDTQHLGALGAFAKERRAIGDAVMDLVASGTSGSGAPELRALVATHRTGQGGRLVTLDASPQAILELAQEVADARPGAFGEPESGTVTRLLVGKKGTQLACYGAAPS